MSSNNGIAIYMRISDEDIEDKGYESNSILNQRNLIRHYLLKNDFNDKMLEYIDDGYSGVNFERPGFKKMIEDARKHKFNCIIVKDFSRLGRNYIETGNLIENVFPFLNIRFISINDNFDSFNKNTQNSFSIVETGFKNLIYELYSKNLSIKIRKSKELTAKKGMYRAPMPPFGYKKNKITPFLLEIDLPAAQIVKRIFDLCADGCNATKIARILNNENIPSPLEYIKNGRCKDKKIFWNNNVVRRLLLNEVYLGHTIYRKTYSAGIRKKYIKNLDERVIRIENTHEPIISKELYEKANNMFFKRTKNKYKKNNSLIYVKKIKCQNCGHYMYYKGSVNRYYYCHTSKIANSSGCFCRKIFEKSIDGLLTEIILRLNLLCDNNLKNKAENNLNNILKENAHIQRKNKNEIKRLQNKKIDIFEKYSLKKMKDNEYLQMLNEINKKIYDIEKSFNIEKSIEKDKNFDFFVYKNKKIIINRKLVDFLFKSILVAKNGEILVNFNFNDRFLIK